jgi:hypothetical protein
MVSTAAIHVPPAAIGFLVLIALALAGARRRRSRARRHSLRYRLYLRSPIWRIRRRIWIVRAGGRCQTCGGRRWLTIHHRTYARIGRERRSDIAVLCWPCHQRQHLHQESVPTPDRRNRTGFGGRRHDA